jgi:hypothetical protein
MLELSRGLLELSRGLLDLSRGLLELSRGLLKLGSRLLNLSKWFPEVLWKDRDSVGIDRTFISIAGHAG